MSETTQKPTERIARAMFESVRFLAHDGRWSQDDPGLKEALTDDTRKLYLAMAGAAYKTTLRIAAEEADRAARFWRTAAETGGAYLLDGARGAESAAKCIRSLMEEENA